MARNRGQNNKKKGEEKKVNVRRVGRYTELTRQANKKSYLLSEANKTEKKLGKLLARDRGQVRRHHARERT